MVNTVPPRDEAAAPKMPDYADLARAKPCRTLLQLGRRGTVEHVGLGAIKQFERVGFDRERSALALQLGDLFDPREYLLQLRLPAGPHLVDIQELACKQRRIRFRHVDPADALALLRHTGALRQIEGKPAGGAVVRRQHATSADAQADRLDPGGEVAPADADTAHGGVAAIA